MEEEDWFRFLLIVIPEGENYAVDTYCLTHIEIIRKCAKGTLTTYSR